MGLDKGSEVVNHVYMTEKKNKKRIVLVIKDDSIPDEVIHKLLSGLRTNDKGCWIRGEDSTIYTTITVNGKKVRAHRLSYKIFNGPILDFACHKCDTPACIRPDHLFEGTNLDNMKDAIAKGRMYRNLPRKKKEKPPLTFLGDFNVNTIIKP